MAGMHSSLSERFAAEGHLLLSAPGAIGTGVKNEFTNLTQNPWKLALTVGEGLVIGTGLALATRSRIPGLAAASESVLPKLMAAAGIADIGYRVGSPMFETFSKPQTLAQQEKRLGEGIGSALVDYPLMGLSGYAGARFALPLSVRLGWMPAFEPVSSRFFASAESPPVSQRAPASFISQFRDFEPGRTTLTPQERADFLQGNRVDLANQLQAQGGELANRFNRWGAQQGLPNMNVGWFMKENFADGRYMPGTGWSSFSQDFYFRGNKAEIVNLLAHEGTHFEQDVTSIRRLADELNIGVQATPEQAAELSRLYQQRNGAFLYDEFRDQVLQSRNGQRLDPAAAARADALMDSFRGPAQPVYARLNEITARRMAIFDSMTQVSDAQRVPDFINSLQDPARRQFIFGSDQLPPKLQGAIDGVPQFDATGKPMTTQEVVQEALRDRLYATSSDAVAADKDYHGLLGEREAYASGGMTGFLWRLGTPKGAATIGLAASAPYHLAQDGWDQLSRSSENWLRTIKPYLQNQQEQKD